jgi:hypothetical protein
MNKQWEYTIQSIPKPDDLVFALDKQGEAGWELIHVSGTTFYFKREKKT